MRAKGFLDDAGEILESRRGALGRAHANSVRVPKVADRLEVQTTQQKTEISKLKAQGKNEMEKNAGLTLANN